MSVDPDTVPAVAEIRAPLGQGVTRAVRATRNGGAAFLSRMPMPVSVRCRLTRCYRGTVRGSLLLTRRGEALS
jgi:hypothetical protein